MAEGKAKAEVQLVKMSDGREVGFAGKRRMIKSTLIDESKVSSDGTVVQLEPGAVSVRFDLRDGTTKTFVAPLGLIAQFVGHGMEQKYGDELASPADKPMSEEDMALALEDLDGRIQKGEWRVTREGGGAVAGAGAVVRAIAEVYSKSIDEVKAFLQKKIDGTEGLTRRALYDSFRAEGSPVAAKIAELEAASKKKAPAVDATAALAGL